MRYFALTVVAALGALVVSGGYFAAVANSVKSTSKITFTEAYVVSVSVLVPNTCCVCKSMHLQGITVVAAECITCFPCQMADAGITNEQVSPIDYIDTDAGIKIWYQ